MVRQLSVTNPMEPLTVRVKGMSEVKSAEGSARRCAESIGFHARDCEEIALAVVELASNLVRHAGGGLLTLGSCPTHGRPGIQIESQDSGPGIPDFEQALADGYSTRGSLGIGLGAINRLMDALEFYSLPPSGSRIVCQRWLRPHHPASPLRHLEFGAATRPYRQLRENGDAFIIRRWDEMALAGVIDGLGHGQFAQRAAQTARQYVEHHFDQPLEALFRGVGRACRATRGVVMALARIDSARQTFAVATIGNIEVRVIGSPTRINLIIRRGVIGLNAPSPLIVEHPWTNTTILIMHSDGLRTHWDWSDFAGLAPEPAGVIAQRLLRALGKTDDDATVLVVRSTPP